MSWLRRSGREAQASVAVEEPAPESPVGLDIPSLVELFGSHVDAELDGLAARLKDGCGIRGRSALKVVSARMQERYPALSSSLYDVQREIVLVPPNAEEIRSQFSTSMNIRKERARGRPTISYRTEGPTLATRIPAVLLGPYDGGSIHIQTAKGDKPIIRATVWHEGNIVVYSEHLQDHYSLERGFEFVVADADARGQRKVPCSIQTAMGITWTYEGKVPAFEVPVPSVPGEIEALVNEGMAAYFGAAADVRRMGLQALPQPEVYIGWMPQHDAIRQGKLSTETIPVGFVAPYVDPDPAFILRIRDGGGNHRDHVLAMWDSDHERSQDLRELVRHHTE